MWGVRGVGEGEGRVRCVRLLYRHPVLSSMILVPIFHVLETTPCGICHVRCHDLLVSELLCACLQCHVPPLLLFLLQRCTCRGLFEQHYVVATLFTCVPRSSICPTRPT